MASFPDVGNASIHLFNIGMLVIVVIGVPAATSVRLASLQIGSRPASETVTIAFVTLALSINCLGWLFLGTQRKTRKIWFKWGAAMLLLLLIELSYFGGILSFDWLQSSLLWLKSRI